MGSRSPLRLSMVHQRWLSPRQLLTPLFAIACSILLTAATVAAAGSADAYRLTAENVRRAADAIRHAVMTEEATPRGSGKYKPFVAGFIRLAFHACVGDRCVGCLNVNDLNNNGLNMSVAALERVRSQLAFDIRRGDLWALAAKVAYEVGVEIANGTKQEADAVRFLYGRHDCPTAPLTDELLAFPQMQWGVDMALQYFRNRGFTDRQTVALLGFHTLGVVRDGPTKAVAQWVEMPDAINNQLYVDLRDLAWSQHVTSFVEDPPLKTHTWGRSNASSAGDEAFMMLNPDVALVRNFSLTNATSGEANCRSTSACALRSATASVVEEYAADTVAWRRDAAQAFVQLIERGYEAHALREPSVGRANTLSSSLGPIVLASIVGLLLAQDVLNFDI